MPAEITSSTPALFLDRDGVINEETGYLFRQEGVRFVPGIFSLCKAARAAGYRIFIVTNQAGIARGYYTKADFNRLMIWMLRQFTKEGAVVDAVYSCPFHPEHGIGKYKREHEDRKPGTGMLHRAERAFGISLADSILVGDRCSDIGAANSAGLRQAFLLAGTESSCPGDYLQINSLAEVEQWLSVSA